MYMRKKEYKKTLNEIGIQKYHFDLQIELVIYKELCCINLKRDERKIKEEKKAEIKTVNSYGEWKKGIVIRYRGYDREYLMEFSRYLNQRIRNVKPGQEYWKIVAPVILTISITEITSKLMTIIADMNEYSGLLFKVSIELFLIIMFIMFLLIVVWQTIEPVRDNMIEENLFVDFKEIIDELITERDGV